MNALPLLFTTWLSISIISVESTCMNWKSFYFSNFFKSREVPVHSASRECKEGCSGLVSTTSLYECTLRGALVPCNVTVCPGTVVTAKCKPAFRFPKGNTEKTSAVCLSTNKWSNSLPACVQDCGKYNPRVEQALVAFGLQSKAGEFPWHVGIYSFNERDNSWQQICGGSIVTSTIILTAAHCVVEPALNVVVSPSSLRIGAGKFFRDWNAEELYVQKSNVTEIIMPDRYGGKQNNYEQDIAMLEISPPLNFSEVVMPCCIDWKQEYTVKPYQPTLVVGWGLTESLLKSPTLRYARLPYLDYSSCAKTVPQSYLPLLTEDKFCAGYTNGTGAREGDSGGGLTFQMDDRYYVYGIVSIKPNIENTIAIFTNVTHPHHLLWFHKYLLWSERRKQFPELIAQEGDCLLPAETKEATFKVSGCLRNDTSNRCRGLEGFPVDNSTVLEYSCKEGFYLPEGRNNSSHCVNEFWTAPPVCDPLCPPLVLSHIFNRCYSENSEKIPCSQYMYPGSTAHFRCFYELPLQKSTCLPNGQWDDVINSCEIECGKTELTPKTKPTHAEAVKSKYSEFPWFMGIYRKSVNGTFDFLCPAIYDYGLFTSATCLYDAQTNKTINPKELRIAANKEVIDWDVLNDELEISEVIDLFVYNEDYNRESYDSFKNDIAVLIVNGNFIPSLGSVVCLGTRTYNSSLSPEDMGTTPGWGISSVSPKERDFEKVSLPHIGIDECRKRFGTPQLLPLMTDDKFCVLHVDGIGIKKYASGSGYFHSRDGHFYAGGVGSFTPPGQDKFTIFTNVTHYEDWISNRISTEYLQYILDTGFYVT